MNEPSGSATPLVCIHGFSGSFRNWQPILPMLEERHRVLVPRLAGHSGGVSLPVGVKPSVATLADQLERDLDAAGIDKAHLVGNSLGGWLSLELAARGRATSVMGLSPALGWEPEGKHLRQLAGKLKAGRAIYSVVANRAPFLTKRPFGRLLLLNGAIAHSKHLPGEDALRFLHDNLECEVYFELMDSFLTTDQQLGAIDCPVQIAWAEKDTLIPFEPYGSRFGRLVPHAEFTTLPDVGHVPMYDDPRLVADAVLEFTGGIDREAARPL